MFLVFGVINTTIVVFDSERFNPSVSLEISESVIGFAAEFSAEDVKLQRTI